MAKANETQVPTETEQNNLKIFDKVSNSVNINHKNCSYCNKPFTEELWCKECDPRRMIEGWTSGNNDVDKFIKDTIYDVNKKTDYKVKFLEWAPFDRFEDVKEIGVGGFAKVYSATWIDGKAVHYNIQDLSWKKTKPKPIKVALKRLNGSENMSAEYLNELKIHWNLYKEGGNTSIAFYGMTKDPETEEFMMILQFADEGNLRSVLSHNFKNILWTDKIKYLYWLIYELSSGKPPFYDKKHDLSLALAICNGLRPEFGKGTPEIYKKLAYKCMNANSNQRPTASELRDIFEFWFLSLYGDNKEKFGYEGKEIKAMFEEADKEIPNISTSYKENPDAIYTSRLLTFNNLTKPVNSSIMTSYLNDEENSKDCQDSKSFDLEVSSSLQLKDDVSNEYVE
ncbi:kinase-like domain-containing protein [Rhizophagus irregularis DAOM 181602=DAOM 197198]|nr:kinase-like domain-containing protein [Rhizophagus irregularis DAOM 181602=DAOM 197198]